MIKRYAVSQILRAVVWERNARTICVHILIPYKFFHHILVVFYIEVVNLTSLGRGINCTIVGNRIMSKLVVISTNWVGVEI